jgi:uracil-DNA glycosylase
MRFYKKERIKMKANDEWKIFLQEEINKQYYINLVNFLKKEMNEYTVYPPKEEWFNCLKLAPKDIKVVIIGQDPYINPNQAHGFSFSVPENIAPPPSLLNIYKEIENEYNITMSKKNGNLLPWVNQGVLLLNSILTVRKGESASHKNKGWELFTDQIIKTLSDSFSPKVFILWGAFAKTKINLIDENKNLILTSVHPSPMSAYQGFFGNQHFIKANNFLIENNIEPINWQIK